VLLLLLAAVVLCPFHSEMRRVTVWGCAASTLCCSAAAAAAVCVCDHAGLVTFDDMQIMLRQLAGSSLSDEDINALVRRALAEAKAPQGLTLKAFKETLAPHELAGMVVEVPTEL
jgi:hypothetical protein